MFQVDLVDDAGVGWHHLEIVKRVLAPAQEAIALGVAFEFDPAIDVQRIGAAKGVDLDGVVDHQFGGDLRVDLFRPAAQGDHRIAHRGQVDHARHPGEVLQYHPCRHEGDFHRGLGGRVPLCQRADVVTADGLAAVLVAQQVLQQDLQAVGQVVDPVVAGQPRQGVIVVQMTVDAEGVTGVVAVMHGWHPWVVRAQRSVGNAM